MSGSAFARWAGGAEARVNSLHGQGVHRLAPGLRALGHAPDGLVEAFAIEGASTFAYAVQWHPEWKFQDNPFYAAIFEAFGRPAGRAGMGVWQGPQPHRNLIRGVTHE